jgi:proline iminopeptidase
VHRAGSENIDRVRLVGHSSGGATAFGFASRYPDRVGRMVLIEPSLLGILLPTDSEKLPASLREESGRSVFERIVAEAALNGPVAGLRTTLAITGGDAWARLDEE